VPLPKYVKAQPDHAGRVRYYFRYRGVYQRLPDDPESAEFYARYSALLAGVKIPAQRPAEGTVGAVIAAYKDWDEYKKLKPRTQQDYAQYLDCFVDFGHWPIATFKKGHIKEIAKPFAKKPRAMQYFRFVASRLFSFAIEELELIEDNPAAGFKRFQKARPYKAWSQKEFAAFEASNPPRAIMTAYMLGRYTGQRRGDILRWTRAVYDGRSFRFRQSKTARLERPEMVIPALPPLRAYLDTLPRDNTVLFVATPDGAAYRKRHFLAQFRAALDAAGLKHLNFHGLRHAAGVALAEAGATEQEIMRWLGHSTPAMAAHYCAQANQKKLAEAAGRKWEAASKENDN
jgi:integrase